MKFSSILIVVVIITFLTGTLGWKMSTLRQTFKKGALGLTILVTSVRPMDHAMAVPPPQVQTSNQVASDRQTTASRASLLYRSTRGGGLKSSQQAAPPFPAPAQSEDGTAPAASPVMSGDGLKPSKEDLLAFQLISLTQRVTNLEAFGFLLIGFLFYFRNEMKAAMEAAKEEADRNRKDDKDEMKAAMEAAKKEAKMMFQITATISAVAAIASVIMALPKA